MVEFGFFVLSGVMLLSPIYIFAGSGEKQKWVRSYIAGILFWLVYLLGISNLGWLDSFGLPPRVPLLIVIPIIVLILFFTSRKIFKEALAHVPVHFAIYIQSFRILVELLIFGAFVNGVFPQRVTFEGLNFDILVGLSAPVIAYLTQRNILGRKGILLWNVAALAILSLTVYSFISSFYFTGLMTESDRLAFVRMPYLLLASVLMPMAVFYHVISIRQQLMRMTK